MDTRIITPDICARHISFQYDHRRAEKLYHTSRDMILHTLGDQLRYQAGSYVLVQRVHQRLVFRAKLFALEYPDLHEQFLSPVLIRQLSIDHITEPHGPDGASSGRGSA